MIIPGLQADMTKNSLWSARTASPGPTRPVPAAMHSWLAAASHLPGTFVRNRPVSAHLFFFQLADQGAPVHAQPAGGL